MRPERYVHGARKTKPVCGGGEEERTGEAERSEELSLVGLHGCGTRQGCWADGSVLIGNGPDSS